MSRQVGHGKEAGMKTRVQRNGSLICPACEVKREPWDFVDDRGRDVNRCGNCRGPWDHVIKVDPRAADGLPDGFGIEITQQERNEYTARRRAEEAEWQSRNGKVKTYRVEDLPANSKLR